MIDNSSNNNNNSDGVSSSNNNNSNMDNLNFRTLMTGDCTTVIVA